MPRERTPLKREYRGDIDINLADIFRNPDIQESVKKELKKFNQNNKKK